MMDNGIPVPKRYYGKYRGRVSNNIDPQQSGRIQVEVPDVSAENVSNWAMPCMPVAGDGYGAYFVPPVGAGVWVEYEQGDPDYPIWSGCWYGSSSQLPQQALAGNPATPNIVLQTSSKHSILISDMPGQGGIILKTSSGAMISITDNGITISNGQGAAITLTSSTVDINSGALTIT